MMGLLGLLGIGRQRGHCFYWLAERRLRSKRNPYRHAWAQCKLKPSGLQRLRTDHAIFSATWAPVWPVMAGRQRKVSAPGPRLVR